MNLMVSKAASQPELSTASTPAAIDVIFHATAECALGRVLVARSAKGVCAILIGDSDDELSADVAARFPAATLVGHESMVQNDLAKVIRFVELPAEDFRSCSISAARHSSGVPGRRFARSQ